MLTTALKTTLLVGFGGFLGAIGRYWLGAFLISRWGEKFPWHTFVVNVTGSLLIGVMLGLALSRNWDDGWRLFLVVGLLGGYTTFSSFSLEAVQLMQKGQSLLALGYAMGSLVACLLATWAGLYLVSKAA